MSGSYPEHLRDVVESYLGELRFSAEPAAEGLEEAGHELRV